MAGVNGIEIKVGQVWKQRDGLLVRIARREREGIWGSVCVIDDVEMADINDDGTSNLLDHVYGLAELVTDENGFTIWHGGEQQPEGTQGTTVAVYKRTSDLPSVLMADIIRNWPIVTRYKVVEQAAPQQPADSATLAEETLQALGWTFDGQAWTEQPKADMEFSVPHVTELPIGMVPNALDVQVGGTHYKDCAIQPIEYIHANKLGFAEGNVVKYITRHRQKHGADDVRKVIHYCQLLLELEYGAGKTEGGA